MRCSAGRAGARAAAAGARCPAARARRGRDHGCGWACDPSRGPHATVPAMAKKGRRREKIRAPEFEYRDEHGSVLVLRAALTPATRMQYAEVAGGNLLSQEDAWQRAVEFLFERLVVRWEIAGAPPIKKQAQLLQRYRFASQEERRFVRESLRAHLAEHFPEMEAP